MFQPVRASAGSVAAGPAQPGRAGGAVRAHGSHWVAPGGWVLGGLGHTPAWCSTKGQPARLSTRRFLPFFFFPPPWLFFFPHFPSIMLAREALFLAAPRAPRRSVERRVCKPEFVVPVPGSRAPPRPGPSRQRGVPGPAGQPGWAAPLHPWPARLLPEGRAPSARPLLLLPRPLPSEARAELRAAVAVPKLLPERLPVGSYGSGRTESSRQCQGDICFPLASL